MPTWSIESLMFAVGTPPYPVGQADAWFLSESFNYGVNPTLGTMLIGNNLDPSTLAVTDENVTGSHNGSWYDYTDYSFEGPLNAPTGIGCENYNAMSPADVAAAISAGYKGFTDGCNQLPDPLPAGFTTRDSIFAIDWFECSLMPGTPDVTKRGAIVPGSSTLGYGRMINTAWVSSDGQVCVVASKYWQSLGPSATLADVLNVDVTASSQDDNYTVFRNGRCIYMNQGSPLNVLTPLYGS